MTKSTIKRSVLEGLLGAIVPKLKKYVDDGLAQRDARIAALEAQVKSLPGIRFRGAWDPALEFSPGDVVVFRGSMWFAKLATAERPDNSPAWTLCVKAGRDGRDAR